MRKVYPIMTLMAFMLFGFMTTTAQTSDYPQLNDEQVEDQVIQLEGSDMKTYENAFVLLSKLDLATVQKLNAKSTKNVAALNLDADGQLKSGSKVTNELKIAYERIKTSDRLSGLLNDYIDSQNPVILKALALGYAELVTQ